MRTPCLRINLFIAAALFGAGAARAQDLPAGKRIAQVWCSNCHSVAVQGATTARDEAPTFLSIAQMKSTTAMSLAAFLTTPHGGMPNLTLSRREIQDLSAYILSLRAQP